MSGLGYKKDVGRCKFCQQLILWGYLAGKKHPYNVDFDHKGQPHKVGSHMDTCPEWGDRKWLRLGDLNTEQIEKWRASCECPETYPAIDWKTVVLFEVPERHVQPIALKLVAQGGSHSSCHPGALFDGFEQIVVRDRKVTAVLLKPAFYNEVHQHLYGSWLSVFGDMSDRKPVSVAGYRLEPSVVLTVGGEASEANGSLAYTGLLAETQQTSPPTAQGCNLAESQDCT